MNNNVTLNTVCKYQLPCGWCEKRNQMCTHITGENVYDYQKRLQTIPIPHYPDLTQIPEIKLGYEYNCCKGCSNNPANGGSGICNCTLPYMEMSQQQGPVVATTVTSSQNVLVKSLDS